MAEYTGTGGEGGQPQEGQDAGDAIGAAAGQAYQTALDGGATPQEAFDAGAAAAQGWLPRRPRRRRGSVRRGAHRRR